MEKIRGFEIAKGFENKEINLPERKTKNSAGYDVEAAEDCVIPAFKFGQKPTLVKTGIKAYMPSDEYLMLCNRSSNPGKKGLVLANSVGIVDSDYYGNPDNDGVIMYAFYNFFESKEAVTAAVYQYLDEEMAAYEYPEDPVERILCAIERVMRLSMAKGIHFLKMATIYEASHTPTIARNDYNGRIFLSTTSDIIISALQNGAEKGVFTFTQPPWYYSDMIILMYRSLLYFWTVNNGQFDSVTPLISYTNYILDSIRTGRK